MTTGYHLPDLTGQEHLLVHAASLPPDARQAFVEQLRSIPTALLARLHREFTGATATTLDPATLAPVPVVGLPRSEADHARDRAARTLGEAALRRGEVAVVIVAGGQGTRLGHPGPKGSYRIGPVTDRSLFQIHAEKVLALSRRYGHPLPFLIMTSPENDADTQAFFAAHKYYGLAPNQVTFFRQRMLPVLDRESGRVLLADRGQLSFSPNGHGGVLQALADEGLLDRLHAEGIRHLFYYQVDNPLVRVADPVFLGHYLHAQADMGVKVVRKTDPLEKLGMVVRRGPRTEVIEYTEFPESLARATLGEGLQYWAGSIAIHWFALDFLRRLAQQETMLPFHPAVKIMPYLDAAGEIVKPAQPNALKFEMFIFDALPLAERSVIVECSRFEEFEPLKNAEGQNSPKSVRTALTNLYASWLESAGVKVPRTSEGDVAGAVEISPLFALDAEELRERYHGPTEISLPLHLGPED
jgi:UDP-N-acetylglucosamine/UDP-N-acetylgalactosamine diphosphorylase